MVTALLFLINDVVWNSIANNAIWLVIILSLTYLCAGVFRPQISALLDSLSSFSVAGTHFELRDKSLALKSYTILSNIFLDLLADSANREQLVGVFSEVNAQHLSRFTIKYLLEAKEETNYALLRNIAYIAGRRAYAQDAIALYDFLIARAPQDLVLRHEKGLFLLDLNASEAKKLYAELMNENPGFLQARYNYAICNLTLGEFEEGAKDLEYTIAEGYLDRGMATRPAIKKLVRARPEIAQRVFNQVTNAEINGELAQLMAENTKPSEH